MVRKKFSDEKEFQDWKENKNGKYYKLIHFEDQRTNQIHVAKDALLEIPLFLQEKN